MERVEHDLSDAQWTALKTAWGGCAYCGASGTALQRDCVLALSRGGRYTLGNIVPVCRSCNASKDPGIGVGAGKAAEGALVTCACTDPAHQTDPASQAFAKTYQDRFGRPPQLYSAEFYDGARLLIDAVRRGARTRDAVLANLKSTGLEGVTKKFSFQPDGEVGVGAVYVYEFRNGAFLSLGTTSALAP